MPVQKYGFYQFAIIYWVIFTHACCSIESQIVYIPESTIYAYNFQKDFMHDLFSHSKSLTNNTYILKNVLLHPNQSDYDISVCSQILKNNERDLCVLRYHPGTLEDIYINQRNTTYLTRPFLRIPSVFLTPCSNENCASQIEPLVFKAMYFIRAFHSSVWSLVLLYILTAATLMFVFEYTYPNNFISRPQSTRNETGFNLLESFLYVTFGMFLQSINKSPKSWGGIVLAIFWHAFCLVIIVAYFLGTSMLIFKEYSTAQLPNHYYARLHQNSTILCDLPNELCNHLRSFLDYPIEKIDLNQDYTFSNMNKSYALVTNEINANYLSTYKKDNNQWIKTTLQCNRNKINLPHSELAFVTLNKQALWKINYYLMKLEDTGLLQKHVQQWLTADTRIDDPCSDTPDPNRDIPVRLHQMHGPLIFMIIGAVCAILTHFSELVYKLVIQPKSRDPKRHSLDAQSAKESELSDLIRMPH